MSINTCSSGHDDVAYDSRHCPLCEAIKERDELIEEKIQLEDKIGSLETEVLELKTEIKEQEKTLEELNAGVMGL